MLRFARSASIIAASLAIAALLACVTPAGARRVLNGVQINGTTQTGVSADDREMVKYLTACCLRAHNKLDEAAALYREVANSKSDAILIACAQGQLGAISWLRKLQKDLETIRQRRQALEGKP